MFSKTNTEEDWDNIRDLEIGMIGEHLVCADLLSQGYKAFLTEQNCPYDIIVDHEGKLFRIQVKTTAYQRRTPQRKGYYPSYMWHVRRTGKRGKRVYGHGEFDALALVALDTQKIAYLKPEHVKQTISIKSPTSKGFARKRFEHYPFSKILEVDTDE